ncbi:MAG: DUF6249 domain-containing protein [Chitinophagales bacterium]
MENTLVPIALFLGTFTMIFGLRYLSNKERMAMIERGMNPGIRRASNTSTSLRWGLIVLGVGIGLLLAFYLDKNVLVHTSPDDGGEFAALYFGLIGIFGGTGLVISHIIERRYEEKARQTKIS